MLPEDRPAARQDHPGGPARLFIALWPTLATRRALAAQQAGWIWPAGAIPTAAESLHLTLHFIGPVPLVDLPEVAQALDCQCTPFTLTLDSHALWPNRCAVLCPSRPPAALLSLHAELAQALARLRLPVEARPFQPHVTLARKAAGALTPAMPQPLRWRVGGYALVRSTAGRYTPLARYACRASG
jgi:2'-5' RNA ligase